MQTIDELLAEFDDPPYTASDLHRDREIVRLRIWAATDGDVPPTDEECTAWACFEFDWMLADEWFAIRAAEQYV